MIKFAVMGDMHYVQPLCHQNTLNGNPAGITEFADTTRNYWMTQNTLPEIISQIKALAPGFVIQTGDLVQGHCDSQEANSLELRQAHELISKIGAKIYYAMGTHDGVPGGKNSSHLYELVYPAISSALGYPVSRGYYKFTLENSLFIVLDYTTYSRDGSQHDFLLEALTEGKKYRHVFLFAHPPLVPVARPFFTDYKFASDVGELLIKYPVDAYFCGHTHNQIASLHLFGDNRIPQLKSSVLGYPDMPPAEADKLRLLLPDPAVCEIGWAYMEDSAPGWWIVNIDGEHVRADWHVLRRGVMGTLIWDSGKPPVFDKIPTAVKQTSKLPRKSEVKKIRLRASGSGFINSENSENVQIFINDKPVGTLPSLEYFDCRQYIEISDSFYSELSGVNAISFTMPSVPCCIGGFVLEIETETETGKDFIRSNPSIFFVNTSKWDRLWNPWDEHKIKHVEIGENIVFTLKI